MKHTVYLFDGFKLDVTRRQLIASGGAVQSLNSRAMEALLLLVEHAGELVEKRRLVQALWPNVVVEDNNLNQCVVAIRKALGEAAGENRYVMTVPGRGYRFVCPVRVLVQESTAPVTPEPPAGRGAVRWLALAFVPLAILAALLLFPRNRPATGTDGIAPRSSGAPESSSSVVLILSNVPEPSIRQLLSACRASPDGTMLRVQLQLLNTAGSSVWATTFSSLPGNLTVQQAPKVGVACGGPPLAASTPTKR